MHPKKGCKPMSVRASGRWARIWGRCRIFCKWQSDSCLVPISCHGMRYHAPGKLPLITIPGPKEEVSEDGRLPSEHVMAWLYAPSQKAMTRMRSQACSRFGNWGIHALGINMDTPVPPHVIHGITTLVSSFPLFWRNISWQVPTGILTLWKALCMSF